MKEANWGGAANTVNAIKEMTIMKNKDKALKIVFLFVCLIS